MYLCCFQSVEIHEPLDELALGIEVEVAVFLVVAQGIAVVGAEGIPLFGLVEPEEGIDVKVATLACELELAQSESLALIFYLGAGYAFLEGADESCTISLVNTQNPLAFGIGKHCA